jgi:hypothetical protein
MITTSRANAPSDRQRHENAELIKAISVQPIWATERFGDAKLASWIHRQLQPYRLSAGKVLPSAPASKQSLIPGVMKIPIHVGHPCDE